MFQMLFSLPRILAAPSIHPCLLSTDEPSYHLKCHILVVFLLQFHVCHSDETLTKSKVGKDLFQLQFHNTVCH